MVIICGPTAVGKTSVALELAAHFKTRIISADSRQCYKELNIGVAKPSVQELQAVHHYFINSHSIYEEVNTAMFEQYALQAADEIFQTNNIAVMVGGTGLYIKAFCEGLDEMPATDANVRRELNIKFQQEGLGWLQNEVKEKDPVFWLVAEQQNPHRLMRALEVLISSGKSITTFRKGAKEQRPFNIIKIGLQLPKEELHRNIHHRVDNMMEAGLLKEVEYLLPFRDIKALQTVGYRELFEFFEGKYTLDEAVINIKTNTRQYAKRQVTWFKKDVAVNWHTVRKELITGLLPVIENLRRTS